MDKNGYVLASTEVIAGNHNDAFNLKVNLQTTFKDVKKLGLDIERTFAWVDKFKRLLIRFERKDIYFFGLHCIAFAMINLRHVFS